ncbi:MAG: hypothetical protein HOI80_05595 [Alphaproteobacteria bacterium]|jgi:hypothetical protein|nr:hypothetical protein [Alphaproteobacteria bacterium]MBT5389145.1 hypothetical protein [Alphaproteobacteria bacterium]MBT5654950.1 hypothetical protein [Alphaproteobacteria bacterium]
MKYSKHILVSFLLVLGCMISSFEASPTPLRGFLPLVEDAVGLLRHCTHRGVLTIAKPGCFFHSTTGQLKDVDDKETSQIFGIPTYDSAFRYMLNASEVRLDFLQTFSQNLDIVSTELLDHNFYRQ